MPKILPFVALSVAVACENNPRDYSRDAAPVSGLVAKGPVAGAIVTARDLDTGEVHATSDPTDAAGGFSLAGGGYHGDLSICSSGGTYLDEAVNVQVDLDALDLCTLRLDFLPDASGQEFALVTPWTHLATARARCLARGGTPLPAAWDQARDELNAFLACAGFTDMLSAMPEFPAAGSSPGFNRSVFAGVLLAGLSQQARDISEDRGLTPGVRITAVTLVDIWARDLQNDCILDGHDEEFPLELFGLPMTADSLRGAPLGFAQAVRHYVEGPYSPGITLDDIRDCLDSWDLHESPFFGDGGTGQLDVDGPEVSVVAPTTGATISSDTQLWLIAVDPSEIVRFEVTDGADHVSDETPTLKGATADLKGTIRIVDLDEGSASLTVEAEDSVGNTSSVVIPFSVDKAAPQITITAPSLDATVNGSVTIDATATDGQGIDTLELIYPAIAVSMSGDSFTAIWDTLIEPDGDYVIRVRAVDTQGHESTADWRVFIDNYAPGTVAGVVSMETPVADASIEVLEFGDGVRGALLGAGTANSDGEFTAPISDTWDGPVLIRAFGTAAAYTDAATGAVVDWQSNNELLAVLHYTRPVRPTANDITGLSINAATTLAAGLAGTMMTGGTAAEQAIDDANRLVGQHLERTVNTDGIPIRWTPIARWLEQPSTSAEQRLLGLFHVGLSRWGAEVCTSFGQPAFCRAGINTLRFLVTDLVDGCLDGQDLGDQDIWVLAPDRVKLEVNTLRSDLAGATSRWLDNIILPDGSVGNPNTTGIGSSSFAETGDYFDALSTNDSALFCGITGAPFDTQPPDVSAHFVDASSTPIDHLTERLKGTVTLVVTATDTSGFALDPLVASPDVFDAVYWIAAPPDSPITAELGCDTTNLMDGEHTISVSAKDVLGLVGDDELTITVDNHPPVLSATVAPYTGATTVPVSWTVSDTVGPIDRIEIRADDAAGIPQLKETIDTPGASDTTEIDLGYCDAIIEWSVTAYDGAGWSTTRDGAIVCDQRPPLIDFVGRGFTQEHTIPKQANLDGTITYSVTGSNINLQDYIEDPTTLRKYRGRFVPGGPNIPTLALQVQDPPTETFHFAVDELQVEYRYSNDGGTAWQHGWTTIQPLTGTSRFEVEFLPGSVHSSILTTPPGQLQRIQFRATDPAGNVHSDVNYDFYMDLLPDPLVLYDCDWTEAVNAPLSSHPLQTLLTAPGRVWAGKLRWPDGGLLAAPELSIGYQKPALAAKSVWATPARLAEIRSVTRITYGLWWETDWWLDLVTNEAGPQEPPLTAAFSPTVISEPLARSWDIMTDNTPLPSTTVGDIRFYTIVSNSDYSVVLGANETDGEAAGFGSWVRSNAEGYDKEVLGGEAEYMYLHYYYVNAPGTYTWVGDLHRYRSDLSRFEFGASLDHTATLTAKDPYFPALERPVEVVYHATCGENLFGIVD